MNWHKVAQELLTQSDALLETSRGRDSTELRLMELQSGELLARIAGALLKGLSDG